MKELVSTIYALLANDKTQHFVYGIVIASLVYPFGLWFSLIFPAVVGCAKEFVDKRGFGEFSVKDALFTAAGGVFLMGWYYIVEILKNLF